MHMSLTSLAKKNLGSTSWDEASLPFACRATFGGCTKPFARELAPGLVPFPPAFVPGPLSNVEQDLTPLPMPTVEVGRDRIGVPAGVSTGVEEAESTLAFLEPDLGVTLELKIVVTGVTIFSILFFCGVRLHCKSLGKMGDLWGIGEAAIPGLLWRPTALRVCIAAVFISFSPDRFCLGSMAMIGLGRSFGGLICRFLISPLLSPSRSGDRDD